MRLPEALASAVLRPGLGAARLGGRVLEGTVVGTVDLVLGSRVTAAAVDRASERLVTSEAAGAVVDRALAAGVVEAIVERTLAAGVVDAVVERALADGVVDAVVERVLAEGLVERTVVRVLDGPELDRVVEAALDSPASERLVAKVIDSHLLDEAVARLLDSEDLWVLVEEIAQSPAVTDAITRQSLGFADQVAGGVRTRSRSADAWLERAARRALRRNPALAPPAQPGPSDPLTAAPPEERTPGTP